MTTEQNQTQPDIVVTRIRFRNFRGIEAMDIQVPPQGVVFAGRNAAGKTTCLMGLRATLEAEGIGPESIRYDAAKAELLVDMNALLVRREITRRKTTLEALARDGSPLPRAKDQVADILGERKLDALALFLASPKEQRQMILSATDVPVPAEDFNRWCNEKQDWHLTGNGLDDLARIRQMYVEQRTAAGKEHEKANTDLAAAEAEVEQAERCLEATGFKGVQPAVQVAEANAQGVDRNLAVLRERRAQTAERAESAKNILAKVEGKRARARNLLAGDEAIPPSEDERKAAMERCLKAAEALQAAQREKDEAEAEFNRLQGLAFKASKLEGEARALEAEALELEQSVPTAETSDANLESLNLEIAQHEQASKDAQAAISAAKAYASLQAARAKVGKAEQAVANADAAWENLQRIVTTLSKDAPAELSKRANLIPDLEITPTAITYQGKPIGQLSSAEQMSLAVMVAKRIQGDRAKILTIDGLERLDPEQQPKFLRMALEGGWQVFGTLVQAGDLAIVDCYELAQAVP